MPDNPQVVIVTQSTVFTRVVPRVLNYPTVWDLHIVSTVPEAEKYYLTGPTVLIIDLRTGGDGLSHLLRDLVNNRMPPTLLTGEPWHVPPWIRERLCNQLIFTTYPIDPAKINAALQELINLLNQYEPVGFEPAAPEDDQPPTVPTPAKPAAPEPTPLDVLLNMEPPTDQPLEAADQLDGGPAMEADSPDLLMAKLEEFLGEDDL